MEAKAAENKDLIPDAARSNLFKWQCYVNYLLQTHFDQERQQSPFHSDCTGFHLILLLIKKKKIRCRLVDNGEASVHPGTMAGVKLKVGLQPLPALETFRAS